MSEPLRYCTKCGTTDLKFPTMWDTNCPDVYPGYYCSHCYFKTGILEAAHALWLQRDAERKAAETARIALEAWEKDAPKREKRRKEQEHLYDAMREQADLDHQLYLRDQLYTPKDFFFPDDALRMTGTWCVGYSGSGKSTLLHTIAFNDIHRKNCAILAMDNKLDFVKPLKTYAPIQDRMVLLEPRDDFFLALNPLDIPGANRVHVIELVEHLLADQLNSAMTGLQSNLFRHLIPTLYDIFTKPTFADLFEVLKNGLTTHQFQLLYGRNSEANDFSRYLFFTDKKHGFDSIGYNATREATVRKLDQLYNHSPVLKNMFNAPETKLDLGKLFDEGKIILIDADMDKLGEEGSHFFLRFMLAYVYVVAQQRSGREQHEKPPVFCYLDECGEWIARDRKVASIQDRCRSQAIGFIWSHQRLENIKNDDVLSALSNCSVKYGKVDSDANKMAEYLHTKPEIVSTTEKGVFSAFYRGTMQHGTLLRIDKIEWEKLPRVEPSIPRENAKQYCYKPTIVTPPPPPAGYQTHKAPETEALREKDRIPPEGDPPIVPSKPPSKKPIVPSPKWGQSTDLD